MNSCGDRLHHRRWILRSADSDVHAWRKRLRKGDVDFGEVLPEISRPDIVKNSNDLPLDFRPKLRLSGNDLFNRQPLSDGIQTPEMLFHELLIHHGDMQAGCSVLLIERSAFQHIDSKCLEISRGNRLETG